MATGAGNTDPSGSGLGSASASLSASPFAALGAAGAASKDAAAISAAAALRASIAGRGNIAALNPSALSTNPVAIARPASATTLASAAAAAQPAGGAGNVAAIDVSSRGNSGAASTAAAAQPQPQEHHSLLHTVLSVLNPLQYVPVVGSIYRAVTGDQIPEVARRIGSLVFSTLLGGPIGAATNIATLAAEKITGIDLDKAEQSVLVSLGLASPSSPAVANAATGSLASAASGTTAAAGGGTVAQAGHAQTSGQAAPAAAPAIAAAATATPQPWSAAQLTAYGVTRNAGGELQLANTSGADVLNTLELARIKQAQVAYAQPAGKPAATAGTLM